MSLAPGSRLGVYEVAGLIGAGGMGEVYRARDTMLGREVAIKALPDVFSADPGRVQRFEREARLLAALNHPHIAAIHGIEEIPTSSGQTPARALVLELVEGPTLAERLITNRPAVREAIDIGRQMADALEAAHDRGIIHRDLKPANVKLTLDGRVKVLDFGLARLAHDSGISELVATPTVTTPGTAEGVILGTARYMSPEQARGQPLDKRTDIWSFGCVLYELLTARAAFPGTTLTDSLAAVVNREPNWTALPADTPAVVRTLLQRCLDKDPKRRLRDIGEARITLDAAMTAPADVTTPAPPQAARWFTSRQVASVSLLIAALAVAFAVWGGRRPEPATPAESVRTIVTLPAGVSVTRGHGIASSVALSPDGRTLVLAGTAPDGQRLYLRPLDRLEATPLVGTEGGTSPFFSPDGSWVGFFGDNRLRRVPVGGGAVVEIARVPAGFPAGASWGPDDRIVFAVGARAPLQTVSAHGGPVEPLTTIGPGEFGHFLPEFLPGGRTVLFSSVARVHALDLQSSRQADLVEGASPRYAAGHVIFSRGPDLLAAPFDAARLELRGPIVPLAERVASEPGSASLVRHYAISSSGTLAYVPAPALHRLVLVNAEGQERLVTEEAPFFQNPRFSPDGRHLAVATSRRRGEASEIWLHDLVTGSSSRLTFEGGRAPIWTPDGTAVTFSRSQGIYTKPADGSGDARLLLGLDEFHWLVGWTPDARTLAYGVMEGVKDDGTSYGSIMAFTGGESRQVLGPGPLWGGRLSPDGRWLVYYSLESGRFEVYVTPFPATGTRWLIAEGSDPAWAPDGTELYYRSSGRLMAARLDATSGVRALSHRVVVDSFLPPLYDDYHVHPDGRSLVLVQPAGDVQGREVTLVLNWFADLERLAAP